jgi:opacity protein-like surface antigen
MRRSVVGIAFGVAALLPWDARAADVPPPTPQYQYPTPPVMLQPAPPAVLQPAPTEYKAPVSTRHYVCYAGAIAEGVESHPTFYNIPAGGIDEDAFADGGRGGVLGGCDIVFASNTFLGMDTSFTVGTLKGAHNVAGTNIGVNFNIPYEWDTRVRLGYRLDEDWSVYIAGGAKMSYNETNTLGQVDNNHKWGGVIAVGWEWQLAQNWRLRGEYEFVWSAIYGVPYPGDPYSQWAPSENVLSLAIMRTFSF